MIITNISIETAFGSNQTPIAFSSLISAFITIVKIKLSIKITVIALNYVKFKNLNSTSSPF